MNKVLIGFFSIAVLVVAAYINRADIALAGINFMMAQRSDIGPNQEIQWQTGKDPHNRAPEDRPPNVILILADDLGWNDLTINGGVAGGTVPTPNIDSIAHQGVNFVNGYAANATCAPSRAAIMSGRYGTRFGFEFTPTPPGMMSMMSMLNERDPSAPQPFRNESAHSVPYEEMGMPASEISLAELLKEQDYHNVHIGKWHIGLDNGMAPQHQGFDESLLMSSGMYLPEDHPNVVNAKQDFDPIDRFLWAAMRYAAAYSTPQTKQQVDFEPGGYITDYYTEEAVKAIEANKDRPFFLYLAHWAPHTPLQATKEDYEALGHIELHRERVYAGMIRSLDRGVGQVLAALEKHDLDDNTLLMFTSDNGGAGYIGLPDVNSPYRGWKISMFEGGIHVPFFAKWPARIKPGTVISDPVHHFDLYATAAAAAGAPLPGDRIIDGVDLTPFARGEAEGVPHRELFWRSGTSQSALVDDWKLNISDPPGREWLFNLREDPTEQNDLSQSHPEKLAELKAALKRHNDAQAAPSWPSQLTAPTLIDKDLSAPYEAGDEYIYWSN